MEKSNFGRRMSRRWLNILGSALLSAVALPAQNVSFFQQNQIPAGSNPVSFLIGDFNGDGIPDLAVADQQAASIRVLLGVGNGFFLAPLSQNVGAGPVALVAGDFNNDGRLDLAVASLASNTISILLGNGNGTFHTMPDLPGSGPLALVAADFDADGGLDLAVVNSTTGSVSVFLGNGTGTFRPALNFAVGSRPVSLCAGDFNNDGFTDLAVANTTSNNVSLLLGNGNGIFRPALNFSAGQAPASIAAGDFNRDGRLDLAVANASGVSGTVSVLLGNGNATFRPPLSFPAGPNPAYLKIADLNDDGIPDLAVIHSGSSSISVLLGLGNGFFQIAQSIPVGRAPVWVDALDVNSDGKLDLLVADSLSNAMLVLVNATAVPNQPAINKNSVVNAASYASGTLAPGEMITIFGSNLGPTQLVGLQLNASGLVADTLAATQVFFDALAAPLVYARSDQVSAIVPYEITGQKNTRVMLQHNGQTSATVTIPVAASVPGLFTTDASGKGPGVVLNQDFSVNSAANPAPQGSIVLLYGTGEGQTNPPGLDGTLAGETLPKPVLPVAVTIDGQDAEVLYAGAAPGLVAGVLQVNVRLPGGIHSGAVPVVLRIGQASSQSGVTVSVQ